jgi:hypothetical protein
MKRLQMIQDPKVRSTIKEANKAKSLFTSAIEKLKDLIAGKSPLKRSASVPIQNFTVVQSPPASMLIKPSVPAVNTTQL